MIDLSSQKNKASKLLTIKGNINTIIAYLNSVNVNLDKNIDPSIKRAIKYEEDLKQDLKKLQENLDELSEKIKYKAQSIYDKQLEEKKKEDEKNK